jgi:thiamine-phosphate pyrophosphorylase
MVAQPSTDFRLYLITDRTQTSGRPLTDVVREALEGGVRAVQLREKDLAGRDLFALARELRSITSAFGARLFINDRLDIALAAGADGVHLGAAGLPVREARRLAGPELLIGYSAHALDEACRAEADGADFITFGPVYHTPSKASFGPPLGVEALKAVCSRVNIPVFALGGVKITSVAEILTAGARGIALISAVMASSDPRQSAASLLRTIDTHVTSFR